MVIGTVTENNITGDVVMKTYQNLLSVGDEDRARMEFIEGAISDHKQSLAYMQAKVGDDYSQGHNTTITNYRKLLYTITGKMVPDRYNANHKCASGFFKRNIIQITSYLLKNGVSFNNPSTAKRLGKHFNSDLYKYTKSALAEGASFGIFNADSVKFFKLTEFVPLYDEKTGQLMAGIYFYQLDADRPLRATLFEPNGYTDYIKPKNKQMRVLEPRRDYKEIRKTSKADGTYIEGAGNYSVLPIVPLWANTEHKSELIGQREQIDAYDLIKSGFANDLDDASMIYWIVNNAGGMEEADYAKFLERLRTLHIAGVEGTGDDSVQIESHTTEVPYQSREVYLERLEKDYYRDAMMLDTSQIAGGNVTATQIEAAYEALDQRAFELSNCITDFIDGILKIAGIDDTAILNPDRIINRREETEMVLMASDYLDEETVLNKLPFLTKAEVEDIMKRKKEEDASRYNLKSDVEISEGTEGAEGTEGTEGTEEVKIKGADVID